jgi:membrane-bound metal-dependent hydrolase YbcI (DUF457 family)
MRGQTHLIAGAAAALPLALPNHGYEMAAVCAAGALGALLPDLDHAHSLAGRWLPWPSRTQQRGSYVAHGRRWFGHTIWHRDEFHSLTVGLLFGLALYVGASRLQTPLPEAWILPLSLALTIGFWSHLFLDLVNVTPQMLLWPLSRRRLRPCPFPGIRQASILGGFLESLVILGALGFIFYAAILPVVSATPSAAIGLPLAH